MRLLITTQTIDLDHPALGFFHGWVVEFARHCETVTVICLKEGRHELPANVRVLSLGKEVRRSRFTYLWRFYHYIYAYRRQYDAVFAHMNPEYVVLGGIFWRQWKKPIVLWYVHRSVTPWLRAAVLLVQAICTVSPQSIRLRSPKIRPIGHGVDTALFAPGARVRSQSIRIVSVGRIARSKGLLETLHALDLLAARGVDFTWTIAGAPGTKAEEEYAQMLLKEIASRPYAQRIDYRGAVPHGELPRLFEQSDVLVNISATGGYDKVVLEAIASGVPALSSSASFRPLLAPFNLFVTHADRERIADAIVSSARADVDALREQVVQHHSLSRLVPRILALFSLHESADRQGAL